ncbi:RloB family protein [Streptomyces virginiae]|uniref:RloB family protein n=1 Tax=Streptomyces virginiae TaxID=1961 RepID=UPI0022535C8C|nr:RloB family protein [Streptomyces virginiae]MCX4962808.1 RloB family protein [Streptomyces virginiae]
MARTRGKDSLGPAKQDRGRRRRVVHVFTEGKVTEPDYIRIIRDQGVYADPSLAVEVRIANASAPGSQRKPIKLVEAAVRLMREEARDAKRSGLKKEFWPQVWCLFDRDEHESIDAALKQARDGDVRVAFSHPCFEVWRLLHHKTVTGTFGGVCGQVTNRLPFAKDAANIKNVLPEQIARGSFAEAKKRAVKMNAAHGDRVPLVKRDPYTDVFAFVEDGLGIASY